MTNFLNCINSVLWGLPMIIFFLFTGIRFTFKSKFFQIFGIKTILKTTLKSFTKCQNNDEVGNFQAFCSVLGACLGTGNIVGVATAIHYGGPGAVFWMWISALFSMATSYAENYLGAIYKPFKSKECFFGGAFSYIENGIKMKGLGKIYALFFLFSSLGMGNMTQSNSLSAALTETFGIDKRVIGIISGLLVFLIISGGVKRLGKIQSILVPFMSIMWLLLSLLIIFKFKGNIIPSFLLIIKSAFSLKGIYGFGIYKAARYGISRGVFSNEAGLGSSTILHAESKENNPEINGMTGMSEVFTDTIMMCSITAIVILVSTSVNDYTLFGTELSLKAYSSLGNFGTISISILTAVFSFTSITSYSFYAEKSLNYIFGKNHNIIFKIFYGVLVFLGSVTKPKLIWTLSDIFNGLMALPNLFAINCLKNDVRFPKH